MTQVFCRSATFLVVIVALTPLRGQDAGQTAPDWESIFRQSASSYEVREAGSDRVLPLVKRPILNWSNPQRKTSAGALFLWTDEGRPTAALCIYPNEGTFDHEFQSLTTRSLRVSENDVNAWLPEEPGLELKDVGAESGTPGQSAILRLRQMRNIARTFSAELGKEGETPRPLRLLTSPLYRYPKPQPDSTIIDGAVFGFVQGTDPEVLLILEAVVDKASKEKTFRFGLARMSMVPMRVKHERRTIWEKNWAQVNNPVGPYFTRKGVGRTPEVVSTP